MYIPFLISTKLDYVRLSRNMYIDYVRLSRNLHIHYVGLSRNLYVHYVRLRPTFMKSITKTSNFDICQGCVHFQGEGVKE